jgi:NAD(P)-dependent dehydrogenase (short-subunit alcohol dehydrogenase family)
VTPRPVPANPDRNEPANPDENEEDAMRRRGSKVVVVTGATSGVGRAVARAFAARGDHVALLARGADGLEGAAKDVSSLGGRALPVPTDVADASAVERAAGLVEDELGPIDVWVNNAMTTVFAPLMQIEPDEFRRVTEVTYLGTVYGTMSALRRMLPRDRGSIVQVGSALAYRSIPLQSAYCGAKHGIQGFSQSLRTELLHDRSRVRLTVVHLPGLNTPQFDHCVARMPNRPRPVPPMYQPEVPADAIVWASDHARREVWVGGTTAATILANRLAPGLLDRYLARTNYAAQQTDEPLDPRRPANLWEPVSGDPGAHGPFDRESHARSLQARASMHRRALGVAALAGGAAAVTARVVAGSRR